MVEPIEQSMLAKDLPFGQFLRLAFLGSVGEPVSGRKLAIDPGTRETMNMVGGSLPIIFFALIFSGTITPTWPNVVVFLVVVVVAFVVAMRAARLVEKES